MVGQLPWQLSKTLRVIAFPFGQRPKGSERSEESRKVSCKFPARDPSASTLCQDDTIAEKWTTAILLLKIQQFTQICVLWHITFSI